MRISDWSSDVCSSDLGAGTPGGGDIAGDHLRRVGQALDLADRTQDALGVTVRRVHHDDVHAGIEQRLGARQAVGRSEEHTSEPQSLMRTSYAGLCLKTNKHHTETTTSYAC